eukprot:TRINITY_DN7149_c0_g2_i1.p5 TRINITY_DN7149_c0_g2~~TRINITY_DN7149_c0_g2_i1.p5  ORF type:complete len:112 (+),score=7.16 TRINITY_DN7149_c0_g2_i1:196-531(+)
MFWLRVFIPQRMYSQIPRSRKSILGDFRTIENPNVMWNITWWIIRQQSPQKHCHLKTSRNLRSGRKTLSKSQHMRTFVYPIKYWYAAQRNESHSDQNILNGTEMEAIYERE